MPGCGQYAVRRIPPGRQVNVEFLDLGCQSSVPGSGWLGTEAGPTGGGTVSTCLMDRTLSVYKAN